MSRSVAELRRKEVERLAKMKNPEPTDEDIRAASRLMNSFYRLCGLAERNVYLANDARTCNTRSTKFSEARERGWSDRLDKQFYKEFGLHIEYCGYLPSIGTIGPGGSFAEKVSRYFYR